VIKLCNYSVTDSRKIIKTGMWDCGSGMRGTVY